MFPALGTLYPRERRGSRRICDRKVEISEEPQAVLLLQSVLAEPDLKLYLWSLPAGTVGSGLSKEAVFSSHRVRYSGLEVCVGELFHLHQGP